MRLQQVSFASGLIALGVAACSRQAPEGPVAKPKPQVQHAPPGAGSLRVHASAAAFSPDGKRIVTGFSGGGKPLTLWDAATGKELRSFAGQRGVHAVAFGAAGKTILSGGFDGRLLLHDAASGRLLHDVQAYKGMVMELVVSADGKLALTWGNDKANLMLWNPHDLHLRWSLDSGELRLDPHLALSPDGKWAFLAKHPELRDLKQGKLLHNLPPEAGWWADLRGGFSPDSRLVLISRRFEHDKYHSFTRLGLWEVGTGKVLRLLEGEGGLLAQFTPDGKQVVGLGNYTGGDGLHFWVKDPIQINHWDVASGKVVRSTRLAVPQAETQALAFSADGRRLFVGTGTVIEGQSERQLPPPEGLTLGIWDSQTGALLRQWERPPAKFAPLPAGY